MKTELEKIMSGETRATDNGQKPDKTESDPETTQLENASPKELVRSLYKDDYGNPFELTDGQEEIFNSIFYKQGPNGEHRVHIKTFTQYGKLLAHDVPVLTIGGWKKHGDLIVGDYVFGSDGKPKKVLALSGESESTREIAFSNGEKIDCHENHEWIVKHKNWKRTHNGYKKLETKKIEKYVLKDSAYAFSVPEITAIDFGKSEALPIDPYTFGVWLGDGDRLSARLCGSPSDLKKIVAKVPYVSTSKMRHETTGVDYYYYGNTEFSKGLSLLGVRGNKHIPDAYKRASIKDRIAMIAGLIDTDGTVNKKERENGWKNGRIYIVNANKRLVDDIKEVLRTLGVRNVPVTKVPACVSSSGIKGKHDVYYIGFSPTIEFPTVLPRKKIEVRDTKRSKTVTITSIIKIAPKKGRCINVEGGVYLVGRGLIPTHNSDTVSMAVLTRAATFPEKWAIVAPSQSKAKIIMGYIIKHLFENEYTLNRFKLKEGESVDTIRRERSKNRLTFDVGNNQVGEIFILSADSRLKQSQDIGNSLMGFGAPNLVEDEAALISDESDAKAMRMVGGFTSGDTDFVVKIGNPFTRGHFLSAQEDHEYFKINIDFERGIEEGRLTRKFVEEMRKKPYFRVLYENKFPESDDIDAKGWTQLLSEDDVESAICTDPEIKHIGEKRIGNDVARGGANWTVWSLRSMNYMEVLAKSRQDNLTEIAGQTLFFMNEHKVPPESTFIDDVGVGGGAVDPLHYQQKNVRGVNVGRVAMEAGRFVNIRAEAYWRLREWIKKGGKLCSCHKDEWLAELPKIKYKPDSKGRLRVMSKDEMRGHGIDSPDVADAAMLTFVRKEHGDTEERKKKKEAKRRKHSFNRGLKVTQGGY